MKGRRNHLVFLGVLGASAVVVFLNILHFCRIRTSYNSFFAEKGFSQDTGDIIGHLLLYVLNHFILFGMLAVALYWRRARRREGETARAGHSTWRLAGIEVLLVLLLLVTLELPFAWLVHEIPGRLLMYHPVTGWQCIPSVRKYESPGVVFVAINSLGLRGPEIEVAKPDGTYRIVLLGDSALFSVLVRQDDSTAVILARRLQQDFPSRRFEVLNACIPGSSTAAGTYILQHRILPLKPDLVIVGFNNDGEPASQPDAMDARPSAWLVGLLVRHSAFFRVLCESRSSADRARPGESVPQTQRVPLDNLRECNRRMALWSRENNFRLLFVGMPEYVRPDNTAGYVHLPLQYREEQRRLAEAQGSIYLDVKQQWGNTGDRALFMHDDYHLAEGGCDRLARDLEQCIIRERLVKGP